MPTAPRSLLTVASLAMLFPALTLGGEFDRLEGDRLARLAAGATAKGHERLTVVQIEALPRAFRDERSAFLVVKTGQGNFARVLVSQALRKPPGGAGAAVPVLVLERFDTFEPGKGSSRVAKGAGVLLFDGFRVDLDAGQVVPDDQGGDLVFAAKGAGGPTLQAVGGASLITFNAPIPADPTRPGPSPGRAIVPADFAGRYRLQADGRWSGLLELTTGEGRAVTGRFRSEANGTSYEVKGEVVADSPRKLVFSVKFPRVEQEYEAYLFTEGKSALAGTFKASGGEFGFFAVREAE